MFHHISILIATLASYQNDHNIRTCIHIFCYGIYSIPPHNILYMNMLKRIIRYKKSLQYYI